MSDEQIETTEFANIIINLVGFVEISKHAWLEEIASVTRAIMEAQRKEGRRVFPKPTMLDVAASIRESANGIRDNAGALDEYADMIEQHANDTQQTIGPGSGTLHDLRDRLKT